MARNNDPKEVASRRTILRSSAALPVAGLALPATAQDGGISGEIELGGRTSGWVGVAPDDIEDERNPTLELVEGEEYTLVWENLDGAGHNFIIEDEDGEEEFVNTDVMSGSGETQEVQFTAEEGMAEYFCGPHPTSMRGEIVFDGDEVDEEDEGAEGEDPEAVQEFAAAVDDLFGLTLDDEGWQLEEAGDENGNGETNPTLELDAGDVYVVTWMNELEEGSELVILAEEDQAFVRSNETASGETSAVTFVATAELEGYRDETTGAEGAIDVEGEIEDAENGDGDDVEDMFLDPPDDDDDENSSDAENASDENGG